MLTYYLNLEKLYHILNNFIAQKPLDFNAIACQNAAAPSAMTNVI